MAALLPLIRSTHRPPSSRWPLAARRALPALFVGLTGAASAQAPSPAALPPLTAVAADGAIRLDARFDEPVWQRAPAYERFQQQDPFTGGPAPYRTRVRIAFDAQALYVAVEAFDPEPSALRAPLVRYDKVFRDQDFVVVYVDGVGTRAAAQFFRVNAAGSVADGVHTAANDSEDFSPDFAWDAAARITDDGYAVEMRLPYASLRFAHHGARPWTMQIGRRMPRAQTYLFLSAPLTRASSSFIAEMQPLQGFAGPRSEASLDLLPALTARRARSETEGPGPRAESRRSEFDAGIDVKWRPRADWIIDATVNPDFSQIELDVPQLSRNRQFALFLQEKRPFFLEGSDLAQTPTSSLYSRSIADPRWGARATFRGDSLAGTVLSVADRGGGLLLIPQPYATEAVAQPASHASTARLRWDGAALSVGALLADRRYADADGRARGANRVAGPDLVWRPAPDQVLRAQWLGSQTSAHPDAAGELRAGDSRGGHLASVEWFRNSDVAALNLRYREASEAFRNDNGFVAQSGFRRASAYADRQFRPATRPFGLNEITPQIEVAQARAISDDAVITQEIHPGLFIGGPRGLELTLQYRPQERTRLAPGATLHDYRQWYLALSAQPTALLSFVQLELTTGELVDVAFDRVRPGTQLSVSGRVRIGTRLEVEPRLDHARLTADSGGRAESETAAQWLSVLHLSARDTLRLIVQRRQFQLGADAAPGVAPQEDRSTNGSLVYAHRRSAATVLYLGAAVGRERAVGARDSRGRAREVFLKAQVGL